MLIGGEDCSAKGGLAAPPGVFIGVVVEIHRR
jgi:hypothetical protein